jgi:hypothetical protein
MAAAAVAPGEALAQASAIPGPVPPAVISALNSAGTLFRLASPGAHPRISKRAAIRDALREAPWRHVAATGISLIRLAQGAAGAPVGSLGWLVSFEPVSTVGGGPAPTGSTPAGAQTSPAADFFVVAVTASKGHFIAAAHAYASPMPAQ